jgi:heme A synthase
MIDRIGVSPMVHLWVGVAVLTTTLVSFLVAILFALRKQPMPAWTKGLLIVTQVVLMVQALLGIKLLDQGSGTVQLYIHYLGGLGPLLFFMLMYWFPTRDGVKHSRIAALVAGSAFVFAFMAFTIGSMYSNQAAAG